MKALNYVEINHLARPLGEILRHCFVRRVYVPKRQGFTNDHQRSEWAIDLYGERKHFTLVFCLRNHSPYFYLNERAFQAAEKASRSPFDLYLNKNLVGRKFLSVETFPNERVVSFWFSSDLAAYEKLALVLYLFPNQPDVLLIGKKDSGELFQLFDLGTSNNEVISFEYPVNADPPGAFSIRKELEGNSFLHHAEYFEEELKQGEVEKKRRALVQAVTSKIKTLEKQLHKTKTALSHADKDSPWSYYGDLLKASLPKVPPIKNGIRMLTDYAKGIEMSVPCDPKLNPQAQIQKFYKLARRNLTRKIETQSQIDDLQFKLEKAQKQLAQIESPEMGLQDLLQFERSSPSQKKSTPTKGPLHFTSSDGFEILVGRNLKENQELTFKTIKGNDTWMHVRGRPGAHVAILQQRGKSIPLQTLLEASHLAAHYSDIRAESGKVEVDYTFAKYVKRIKGSEQVSYTENKTLLIDIDEKMLRALFQLTEE